MTIITRKEQEEGPHDAETAEACSACLVAIFSVDRPQYVVFPLSEGSLHLGRDELVDAGIYDDFTSKRHLRVDWNGESFAVSDAGSTNGTFLQGQRVTSRTVVSGPPIVRIGRTLIVCQSQPSSSIDAVTRVKNGVVEGPKMQAVYRHIQQLASTGESLLLIGESGAGKEIAARHFHHVGPRKGGPFIAVNCASIPRDLAERLLFGARRGAYSGAVADADGYIQAAHGGTLFLDEVAELEPANQAKLLRVLENREVQALGATRAQRIDLSVCAATQRDLLSAVAQGRFRQDLYYRIGRPEVTIPPLRERSEEIPLLIDTALREYLDTLPNPPEKGLSASTSFVEACLLRPWPGNVRELRTEVRSAALRAVLEKSSTVSARHLGARAGQVIALRAPLDAPTREEDVEEVEEGETHDAREFRRCVEALHTADGNVNRAAQELGISRGKLRRLIERHQIDVERLRRKL